MILKKIMVKAVIGTAGVLASIATENICKKITERDKKVEITFDDFCRLENRIKELENQLKNR